ncbi:dihydrolipoyl dehydrogenase family protein [Desulfovibrio inopinatus]|uniref:dihydrolipoyl dehydrogenase family protein n=1 Tax=Desulfovibrio inopinatus TaxID=102109 RepID=UPI0003F8B0CC|nr:NAD(P)/FAD-dependent oxidoreductase [Desulfovibrio inopinatus]
MPYDYDVIVIGSGPAGGVVARQLHSHKKNVAVIDAGPFGGVCPNTGCEPKKVLVESAAAVARVRHMSGNGVLGAPTLDWPALMKFKRSFTEPISELVQDSLEGSGIATYEGAASFAGPNEIAVGEKTLSARHIAICTGARPRHLTFSGAERVISSDEFLELDTLPKRIAFVGSGFIAFEFAHVAATAGSQVAIFQPRERSLRQFDIDMVRLLVQSSRNEGISIYENAPISTVQRVDDGLEIVANDRAGTRIVVDCIVNAAGRVPDIEHLALDKGEIEMKDGGVSVNAYLQSTTNPAVYAAGDVLAKRPALTPVAVIEAQTVVENILSGNTSLMRYPPVPSAVFTDPPLARVGLNEDEARAKGLPLRVITGRADSWSEYERLGRRFVGYKLLVDSNTNHIYGAHILGDGAEEVINLLAMAMRHKLTTDDLMNMVFAYPSFGYTIRYMLR